MFEKRFKQYLEEEKGLSRGLIGSGVVVFAGTAGDADTSWGRLQDALSTISGLVETSRAK